MRRFTRLAVVATAALTLLAPGAASAADHLDGPQVKANGALDINDVYAFEGAEDNTVLIMTVNPAAGVISGTTFQPGAEYIFSADADGDAVADADFTVVFDAASGDTQSYTLTSGGEELASGTTGETVDVMGGGMIWAGLADDPFFFDLDGFMQLKQTLLDGGDLATATSLICDQEADVNFFAGFNTSAIVLEVPDEAIGGEVGLWASTMLDGAQVDRMAKPGINTVFITGDDAKDAYNSAAPADDASEYTDEVVGITAAIQQALGVAEADAMAYGETVAGILLPDVVPFNTAEAADFSAFNGRTLEDDVIDVEYSVLTTVDDEPALTGDCVANDSEFRSSFPYLAVANMTDGMGGTQGGAQGGSPTTPSTATTVPAAPSPLLLIGGVLMAAGVGTLAVATVRARR